jgi:1,4-dihydroxy-2-naphthoyl-CoA hydrolase
MDDQAASFQSRFGSFFPALLGIRITSALPQGVTAELEVRDELCTVPGILHGGAIMAFADTLGAVGTSLNLPPGAGTTTIESKTNFFRPGIAGTTVRAECAPLNIGRRTQTWQTNIFSPEGQLLAQVTQTQFVIEPG